MWDSNSQCVVGGVLSELQFLVVVDNGAYSWSRSVQIKVTPRPVLVSLVALQQLH